MGIFGFKRKTLLLTVWLGLFVMLTPKTPLYASVVKLVVVKPVAVVYERPDFDSPVIYQLPAKKQVYGTRKTIVGEAGLGLFHKIRLRKGVYGYILDTEVRSLGGTSQNSSAKDAKKKDLAPIKKSRKSKAAAKSKDGGSTKTSKSKEKTKPKEDSSGFQISQPQKTGPKNLGPFFFRKYVGLNLGMVKYSEKIVEGTKSSQEWMAGIKLTGTDWIFKNFLLDINVNVHVGAPQFFEDFSTDASGFLVQADLTMPFMLKPLNNGAIYGGLGPLVSASSYKFNYLGEQRDSQNVRLGAVVMLGVGYELGGFAFRLEPKYYWEKSRYFGVLAGIQKRL